MSAFNQEHEVSAEPIVLVVYRDCKKPMEKTRVCVWSSTGDTHTQRVIAEGPWLNETIEEAIAKVKATTSTNQPKENTHG